MYPPKNPDTMMSIVKICRMTQADMYMYGTVYSVIETGQRKATPFSTPLFLKRKRTASGGIGILHTRQTLYQLSHRGSSAGQAESLNVTQGQRRLFPD